MAKSNVFTIKQSLAVALFVAAGVQGAAKWSADKLAIKCKRIRKTMDADAEAKVREAGHGDLLDDVFKAADAKQTIEIDADGAAKSSKAAKAAKSADKSGKTSKAAKPAKKSAKAAASDGSNRGRKPGEKKVGVVATILDCLNKATEKKPVTLESIVKVLAKKFPDRDVEKMKATARSSKYCFLVEKGITVEGTPEGYWLNRNPKKSPGLEKALAGLAK